MANETKGLRELQNGIYVPELKDPEIDYKTPGSNQGQGAVARTNATNAAIYANAQNEQAYSAAYNQYVLDATQQSAVKGIKDATAAEQYALNMQQRDIGIQGQLQAYERNAQNVAAQLEMNRLAAVRANTQAESVLKSRLKAEDFKLQQTTLDYTKAYAQDRAAAKEETIKSEIAQMEDFFQQNQNNLVAAQEQSALDFQGVQQTEQFLENQARQKDLRDNLIRKYDEFTSESQFNYDQLKQELSQSLSAQQFQRESDARGLQRVESLKKFESESLTRQQERYEASKEFEKAVALKNFEDTRAANMFKQEQRLFQQTQQLGAQLSRGQRGRSAARGMRSISALAGIDLAQMADQIDRAEEAYGMTRDRADAEIAEQRKETQARKLRIQGELGEQRTETAARQARSREIDTETTTRINSRKSRTQQRLNERRTESLDLFNQSIDADGRAHDRLMNADKRRADQKAESTARKDFRNQQSTYKKTVAQKQAEVRKKLISQTVGIKAEVFKMDRRAIGESLLSAMSAYESAKDDIWLKKYEADVKTYANRMFEPQFADAPKPPFAVPKFDTLPPSRPIEVPKGSVAPRPEAPKQSGLSKALAIGGMILGAVTAPLTAGVSAGVIGALAPIATGAVGGGLSAASAFT